MKSAVNSSDRRDIACVLARGASLRMGFPKGLACLPGDERPFLVRIVELYRELEIPLVTLHNTRDPLVPISHEVIYADLVAEAGASGMLLQRTSQTFGHCVFTEDEWLGAFIDLVSWVETGVKPSP